MLGARRGGAEVLVTTEKDLVRIVEAPEGSPPIYALSIQAVFPTAPGLQGWILDRLAALLREARAVT